MSSRLEEALAYARDLSWYVFPVKPDGKSPRTAHGFKDATIDLDVIATHWTHYPDDNIGIAVGMSGLVVVDEDPRNGGDTELEDLEQEYGPLPRDVVQATAGGGRHFVMRMAQGRPPRGKVKNLGESLKGLDIKQNGYILAEGSTRTRDDGTVGRYEWQELDVANLSDVPEAWLDLLYWPPTGDAEAPEADEVLEAWIAPSDPELAKDDAIALQKALAGLGERGSGGGTTFKAISWVFHDWGLGIDDGWPFLVEWNEGSGQPHSERELQRQVRRVAARPQLGKRGRARRAISFGAQVARAAILRDSEEAPMPAADEPASDDEESPAAAIAAARAAHPSKMVERARAMGGLLASADPDAEVPTPGGVGDDEDVTIHDTIDAALAAEDPPCSREIAEAHLTLVARKWARAGKTAEQLAAGKAVAAAVAGRWTPVGDVDAAIASLAKALVSVAVTPAKRGEAAPNISEEQLVAFLPFRADKGAAAVKAALASGELVVEPARALVTADSGRDFDPKHWGDSWDTDREGLPKPNQTNARLALHRMNLTFCYDEFAQKKLIAEFSGVPGSEPDREVIEDHHEDLLWSEIESRYGFQVDHAKMRKWIGVECRKNKFNPVRDFLAEREGVWDGVSRVGGGDRPSWLTTYCGVADSELARAIGRIVLVAAVRRIRSPGCKFDETLVLEGKQGAGKTTIVELLARKSAWYGSSVPFDLDNQRQYETLQGKWIVEAGELSGLSRADKKRIKEFCSRRFDEARVAYAHNRTTMARQCIFIGTTNDEDGYFDDPSGARRFWPFKTGDVSPIDVGAFAEDVDQLWSEAATLETAGEEIGLHPSLYAAATAEQEKRRVVDPLEDALVALGFGAEGHVGKISKIAVREALGMTPDSVTQAKSNAVGAAMRKLGWESRTARYHGPSVGCYVRGSESDRERVTLSVKVGRIVATAAAE